MYPTVSKYIHLHQYVFNEYKMYSITLICIHLQQAVLNMYSYKSKCIQIHRVFGTIFVIPF